jgi:hypothetical protein
MAPEARDADDVNAPFHGQCREINGSAAVPSPEMAADSCEKFERGVSIGVDTEIDAATPPKAGEFADLKAPGTGLWVMRATSSKTALLTGLSISIGPNSATRQGPKLRRCRLHISSRFTDAN